MHANLQINLQNYKKMTKKLTPVGLKAYRDSLVRVERVKLTNFIALELGISSFSVIGKFAGRQQWKPAELMAIETIINKGLWRT